MSSNNMMYLRNDSVYTIKNYWLTVTNSGQDISVLAGHSLPPATTTTDGATFTIDKGRTNTWMLFFQDESGEFLRSDGNVADLASGENYSVWMRAGSSGRLNKMQLDPRNGQAWLGWWDLFSVYGIAGPNKMVLIN